MHRGSVTDDPPIHVYGAAELGRCQLPAACLLPACQAWRAAVTHGTVYQLLRYISALLVCSRKCGRVLSHAGMLAERPGGRGTRAGSRMTRTGEKVQDV